MTTKNEAREAELMPAGIVIRDRQEPQRRPAITAFIWGGKVRPTPSLPFGNQAA
ncbi:MAG: hypothetical protein ACYC28_12715 [Longimicrobiales bacterium]